MLNVENEREREREREREGDGESEERGDCFFLRCARFVNRVSVCEMGRAAEGNLLSSVSTRECIDQGEERGSSIASVERLSGRVAFLLC